MTTLTIDLPDELARFLQRKLEAGDYSTADEIVSAGLRLLRHDESGAEERLAILRREIAVGLDDLDAQRLSARSARDIAGHILGDAAR